MYYKVQDDVITVPHRLHLKSVSELPNHDRGSVINITAFG